MPATGQCAESARLALIWHGCLRGLAWLAGHGVAISDHFFRLAVEGVIFTCPFGRSRGNSRHKKCSTERKPVSESLRTHSRKDGHRVYENRNFGKTYARQIKQSKSELGSDCWQTGPQRPVRLQRGDSAHRLSEVGGRWEAERRWDQILVGSRARVAIGTVAIGRSRPIL
jgi:hypothetical protein